MNYVHTIQAVAEDKKRALNRSALDLSPLHQRDQNHPKFETWWIKQVVRPGIYTVKNQDDSQQMRALKAVCKEVTDETGQAVVVGFTGPKREGAYILRILGAPIIADVPEVPVSLLAGWRAWHADFLRSNSWTDEPITPMPADLDDCETSATTWYGGATDALLRYERGDDFGEYPHWYGPRSYAVPDAPQSQGFGGSESANEAASATSMGHTWDSILSSVDPDYSYFGEVSSLSRVGGILYAELEAWVYDYDAAEDRPASFACAIRVQGAIVDGSPATFGELLWAVRWQP